MSADSEKVDGEHRYIKPKHERTADEMRDRAKWEADQYDRNTSSIEEVLWKQVSGDKGYKPHHLEKLV